MIFPRPVQRTRAPELAADKRERALLRSVSDGLLHGAGTVWGLGAAVGDVETNGRRTRVLVRSGLAVDALGRELYVDREQCLDVESLVQHPIWRELVPPENSQSPTARRAYIVLRFDDCHVEAEQATVSSEGGAPGHATPGHATPAHRSVAERARRLAAKAAQERFRIELCPSPPPDPNALRRRSFSTFFAADPPDPPRDAVMRLLLQDDVVPPSLRPTPWLPAEAAPLLLATLDLDVAGSMAFIVPGTATAPNPDNRPRVTLPPARAVAESLFGRRLFGS